MGCRVPCAQAPRFLPAPRRPWCSPMGAEWAVSSPCWPGLGGSFSRALGSHARSSYTPPHSKHRAHLQPGGGSGVSSAQTRTASKGGGGQAGHSPRITFTLNRSLRRASSTLKLHFTSSYSAWGRESLFPPAHQQQ